MPPRPRLLDQVRDRIRFRHYSIRTEQAYVDWIKRFIRFHGKRHPSTMGASEVEAFLTDLAVARGVSASTQNQAQSALLFLYKDVLGEELPWLDGVERARKPIRLPVVLTRQEVLAVLRELHGIHNLIGRLLYGTGMRILEAMRLRVKDVEFDRRAIIVRDGKGGKDRITVLPAAMIGSMRSKCGTRTFCISAISHRDSVVRICRTHSRENIRRRTRSGRGNTFFQRRRDHSIREAVPCVVITSATKHSSAR